MKRLSYTLLSALLIFATIGCADTEDTTPTEIEGLWESVEVIGNSQFFQSLVYSFGADNSYEAVRVVGQQDTREITGFLYRESGTYVLEESTLRLTTSEIFVHTGSADSAERLEDLTTTSDTRDDLVSISFEDNSSVLVIDYPACGPNDNCIDKQSFVKKTDYGW